MIKRIIGVLFVLAVLQCALSRPAVAQTAIPPACQVTMSWWSIDPVPFGWSYYQSYPGTFVYLLQAMAHCSPPCPWCQAHAQHPIGLATGDTYIDQQDIQIPGLGGGLSLTRSWHSNVSGSRLPSLSSGMFGPGWRSNYEERIVMSTDGFVTYLRGDGTYWTFGAGPTMWTWVPIGPANAVATLATDTCDYNCFTLTFPNGEQHVFNALTGLLESILDRNGNTTWFAYDSSWRLKTVTDPASRTLTFTYDTTFTNQVASVSTSVGISYSYSYDTNGQLSKVTKPDSTTVAFTYGVNSMITSVTDSNGKVLESHTYDSSGRGLTGSQANGVQAVTISYQ